MKYLGEQINKGSIHKQHIQNVSTKIADRGMALAKIMLNNKGTRYEKTLLLNEVLYGALIWYKAMSVKRYRYMLQKGVPY